MAGALAGIRVVERPGLWMSWKRPVLLPVGVLAVVIAASFALAAGEQQTVGLFLNEEAAYDGYTLFAPVLSDITYLISNDGMLVHSWESSSEPGLGAYLLESGHLMRPRRIENTRFPALGGGAGRVEEIAWDGTVVWEFEYSTDEYSTHHDVEVLPNGNVLMIAWEVKTSAEAIAAGRDPALLPDGELWPEHIIEVQPTGSSGGDIVWEWHVWDHMIQDFDPGVENFGLVADHPELIDINYAPDPADDWIHANGIDYNPQLDQIVLSLRKLSELWVIDHSTTTEEAAGHSGGNSGKGGDLLYRWGNPQTYGAGDESDRVFFYQHDAQWIEPGLPGAGNILAFNNGPRPEGDFSSVEELAPPVDGGGNYALTPGEAYAPEAPLWTYTADEPAAFYSEFISGAQRFPNGNTLIDDGMHGTFFEVTPAGQTVWRYVNPVTGGGPLIQGRAVPSGANLVFRAYRYALDFPGLLGKDLTPMGPIERGFTPEDPEKDPLGDTDGDTVPNDTDLDDDGDGCLDKAERANYAGSELSGGNRQPHYFWDFFDVWTRPPGDPAGWHRDRAITLSDILAIVLRFGGGPDLSQEEALAAALTPPVDATSYHAAYDRGPIVGATDWHRAPPDGVINIPDDILGVADQFGHDCT